MPNGVGLRHLNILRKNTLLKSPKYELLYHNGSETSNLYFRIALTKVSVKVRIAFS